MTNMGMSFVERDNYKTKIMNVFCIPKTNYGYLKVFILKFFINLNYFHVFLVNGEVPTPKPVGFPGAFSFKTKNNF